MQFLGGFLGDNKLVAFLLAIVALVVVTGMQPYWPKLFLRLQLAVKPATAPSPTPETVPV